MKQPAKLATERSSAAALDPSPERRQHDRVTRAPDQVADTAGAIGSPWRAEGLLARLERHGDIGPRERAAGEHFAYLFHLAHLDPLRAADVMRGSASPHASLPPNYAEHARRRVSDALLALGGSNSPAGSCAWFVLGSEMSIRQWALRQGWAGRPIREQVAKGTLIACLGVLRHHFGT